MLALTTRSWLDDVIEIESDAWLVGGTPKQSNVAPWSVQSIDADDIDYWQGRITSSLVDRRTRRNAPMTDGFGALAVAVSHPSSLRSRVDGASHSPAPVFPDSDVTDEAGRDTPAPRRSVRPVRRAGSSLPKTRTDSSRRHTVHSSTEPTPRTSVTASPAGLRKSGRADHAHVCRRVVTGTEASKCNPGRKQRTPVRTSTRERSRSATTSRSTLASTIRRVRRGSGFWRTNSRTFASRLAARTE